MFFFTVGANTSASNTSVIIGSSGGNISCTSTGVPIPTITWTDGLSTTPFMQSDIITENSIEIDGGGATNFTEGSLVSTLLLVNPIYPDDEGMYVCTGENEYGNTSVIFTVQILGNNST